MADHTAVMHLTIFKHLSNRIIGWLLIIAEFNFVIEHRTGTTNVAANCIPRDQEGQELDITHLINLSPLKLM